MTGIVYKSAPKNIFHSWVELSFESQWYALRHLFWTNSIYVVYRRSTGMALEFSVATVSQSKISGIQ